MKLPARVTICEVGTRDGFQIEPDFIPTGVKVEVVRPSRKLPVRRTTTVRSRLEEACDLGYADGRAFLSRSVITDQSILKLGER